LKVASSSNW